MKNNIYGYIRVSTREQREDRQRIALLEAGVPEKHLITDKQSGKDFDRPGYQKLCKKIKPGDTLCIKSIDRLGRSYNEILDQWRYLTKERRVSIVVLDMPLLDTRKGRDLAGELISDIVLQLLSYVAQTEREFIRQRQAEGIAAAKLRGVQMGRPRKPMNADFDVLVRRWRAHQIPKQAVLDACGISESTLYRRLRERTGEEKSECVPIEAHRKM